MSQAQAARELDVARTAYRLWELEAAKPSPDRWRLISRWLGVSVTTMLLAEDLLTEEEAARNEAVEQDFGRAGRDWDTVGASKSGDFFTQMRELLRDGVEAGEITATQATGVQLLFDRINSESRQNVTGRWQGDELRKTLAVDELAPRHARNALAAVAVGAPTAVLHAAELLTSELVTNSVRHGPSGDGSTIGLFIVVDRETVRVEVSDDSPTGARPRTPSEDGGYGLALVAELASRWGAGHTNGRNLTWFEIDLGAPGA